ncbi:peptidase [Micromonospora sp. NPDC049523]|uniref:peptidase n=1 Tax=Micromonospora sp. NPDC049523 TaxID=3155921 RepID=UPI00341C95E0
MTRDETTTRPEPTGRPMPARRLGAIRAAVLAVAVGAGILVPGAIAAAAPASPSPTPTSSADPDTDTVTTAGTSFLTATTIRAEQPVDVAASSGDYLYWQFTAFAGETNDLKINVTLPPAADRHGPSTWTVDVFDGLRRRQACTEGAQTRTAKVADTTLSLGCKLRQVRSWAEPWSGDPLPGAYYVRLSVTDLPEQDLGLPTRVGLGLNTVGDDEGGGEGVLSAPLGPSPKPKVTGSSSKSPTASPSASESAQAGGTESGTGGGLLPDLSAEAKWILACVVVGIVALVGFTLAWRTRRP